MPHLEPIWSQTESLRLVVSPAVFQSYLPHDLSIIKFLRPNSKSHIKGIVSHEQGEQIVFNKVKSID